MPETEVPQMSAIEALILRLIITERGDSYGLDLVKRSDGELKRGTVYVTLQRMEEKGFISSRLETKIDPRLGQARRMYKTTGLGERALAARDMVGRFVLAGDAS